MSVSAISTARPPYVRFEYKDVEDRAATIKEGRYVSKSVAFAYIMSPGSKDELEKSAEEWLDTMRKQSVPGREYMGQWHDHFHAIYDKWKLGHEIPETGTPVRTCPIFRPHEVAAILAANVRTLEDLDGANEETLARMGIGSRTLQTRAREFIAAGRNVGASAEQVSALLARVTALEAQLADKDAALKVALAPAQKATRAA